MITAHKIADLPFHASPNVGSVMQALPDTIVIHYTGGDSLSSAVGWLSDHRSKASAHVVIGEAGEMVQMVAFNRVAWHAGVSYYQGRSNFNQFSIGIELVNPGKLMQVGDSYQAWFGKEYPQNRVIKATHSNESLQENWCSFPEAQLKALKELILVIKSHYPIKMIVGHEEIAPKRKADPGPAFPLQALRRQLLDIDRDGYSDAFVPTEHNVGEVSVDKLNLRHFIGGTPRSGPLIRGQQLKILAERDGWLRVKVEETGWVKKEYVKTTGTTYAQKN